MEAAKAIHKGSSISRQVQEKRQPFFRKEGEGGFFSKLNESSTSFFNPNSIQPKLTIGQPNDRFEVEADAMADKVVQRLNDPNSEAISNTGASSRSLQTKSVVQKKCNDCEEKEKLQKKEEEIEGDIALQRKPIFESNTTEQAEAGIQPKLTPSIQTKCSTCELKEKLQKKEINPLKNVISVQASTANSSLEASPDLQGKLNSSKGRGSALPSITQANMGAAFGADFGKVKVHTGSDAIQMNKELGAQAFTYGNDIYFNQGKYDTSSNTGQHLLAHELTHTIQQGSSKSIQRTTNSGRRTNCHSWTTGLFPWLAGTAAHGQIAGFMTALGIHPQAIPRATKRRMGTPLPPSGTNLGFADLWTDTVGDVKIAEIKSTAAGDAAARPEANHYINRHNQWLTRFVSGTATDTHDSMYTGAVGGPKPGTHLDISSITGTGITLGPFVADPLKLLWFEGDSLGSVVYWCTDWMDPILLAIMLAMLAALREAMRLARELMEEALETARAIMEWIGENWEVLVFIIVLALVIALIIVFIEAIIAFLVALGAAIAAGAAAVVSSLTTAGATLAAAAALLIVVSAHLGTVGIDGSEIQASGTELANSLLIFAPKEEDADQDGYDQGGQSSPGGGANHRETPDYLGQTERFVGAVSSTLNPAVLIEKAMNKLV